MYGVFILVFPQATHIFDINGCDALLHSVQNHIVRDWKRACDEVCHHHTIQRFFMQTLRQDAEGEIDESLVPWAIRDWYVDSEDEQDTTFECDSDCK